MNVQRSIVGFIYQYTLGCYICNRPAISYTVQTDITHTLPNPKFNLQDIPEGWCSYGGGIVICTNPECIDTYYKSLNLTNKGD